MTKRERAYVFVQLREAGARIGAVHNAIGDICVPDGDDPTDSIPHIIDELMAIRIRLRSLRSIVDQAAEKYNPFPESPARPAVNGKVKERLEARFR